MMPQAEKHKALNLRTAIAALLIPAALAMLIYGFSFNSYSVRKADSQPPKKKLNLSEADLIFDTTVGGVTRESGGTLRRTYGGKPPSTCPT